MNETINHRRINPFTWSILPGWQWAAAIGLVALVQASLPVSMAWGQEAPPPDADAAPEAPQSPPEAPATGTPAPAGEVPPAEPPAPAPETGVMPAPPPEEPAEETEPAAGPAESAPEPKTAETEETAATPAEPEEPTEAKPEAGKKPPARKPGFTRNLVLDTGRTRPSPAAPDTFKFQIHGQYQFRAAGLSDLPLQTYRQDPETDSLGQTTRLYHWARFTPRLSFDYKLHLIGQFDFPHGFMAGQTTEYVGEAREPLEERDPFQGHFRWLYLEWLSPIGLFRVGQQPSHWGMGILANDGDHPTLFGDYQRGSIARRIFWGVQPFGRETGITVALAGDLIAEDNNVDPDGDESAVQGVLALFYTSRKGDMIGLYGVYRHQDDEGEVLPDRMFEEDLDVFIIDSAGKYSHELPALSSYIYGQYEVAVIVGETDLVRTVEGSLNDESEDVLSWGGAIELGMVHTDVEGKTRWGKLAGALELGYASGDPDPNDGTTSRFSFDPNHNVGLLIFDEVLAWKTARAAIVAQDPEITARPSPGVQMLPSNGSISGAAYLNPTVVYRPVPELDLKAGAVFARASSDFVSPVRLALEGRFRNYDGGDATERNLGIELDLGVEYRLELGCDMRFQFGAQGGVLFPGAAFDDAEGNSMDNQYIGVGRLGFQY